LAKRILLTVLQFCAFFGLLYAGGYWDIISLSLAVRAMQGHPIPLLGSIPLIQYPMGSHILIADGIIFATILLVILVIIQALRKKLKPAVFYTLGAYALAIVITFCMKIGLPPAN